MKVKVFKNGKEIWMEKEFAQRLVDSENSFSFEVPKGEEKGTPKVEELTKKDLSKVPEDKLLKMHLDKFGKEAASSIKRETLIKTLIKKLTDN